MKALPRTKLHPDYWRLIKNFPLRPIRTHAEYDRAAAVLDRLAVKSEDALSSGELDYLETLEKLIAAYDDEHFPMPVGKTPLHVRLQTLVEEEGVTGSELGRVVGHRTAGWALLRGRRRLTWSAVQRLCDRFRVSADYFRD